MIKYLWCHRLDIFVTNDFVFSVSERSIQLEEHIPVYERKAKNPRTLKALNICCVCVIALTLMECIISYYKDP